MELIPLYGEKGVVHPIIGRVDTFAMWVLTGIQARVLAYANYKFYLCKFTMNSGRVVPVAAPMVIM